MAPPQLHFLMFPYMAQGHMIPMVDFGRLLARRGIIVTFVTTPHNAARFRSIVDRDCHSFGLMMSIAELDFPVKVSGLPEGIENQDQLPCSISDMKFMAAARFLQEPAEKLFKTLKPRPNCIISDVVLPFTLDIARKFNIPRIAFYVFNCFSNVIMTHAGPLLHTVKSQDENFVVPGLPHRIEIKMSQTPASASSMQDTIVKDYPFKMYLSQLSSFGTVVNSFLALEAEYLKLFAKQRNKVWCVGPVSLCNSDLLDMAERGKKAAVDQHICLKWLDSQAPSSVLYISFGSLCNPLPKQLIELALGLDASNRPFIWALKGGKDTDELKNWAEESQFEERVKGRGFLIWGWAPQVLILSHGSIGGFLNHCGSSATLEGISMGVPFITWPLMYDQFLTERMVVDVLKIAVSVGVKYPLNREEGKCEHWVRKEDVKAAIDKLMEEGEESTDRRRRVKELAEKAKRAVEEGGSSHLDISKLIKDVMEFQVS